MDFIGIDLHTNKFACCHRDERSLVDNPAKGRVVKTFELGAEGLAVFYLTLTSDTYVLAEIFQMLKRGSAIMGKMKRSMRQKKRRTLKTQVIIRRNSLQIIDAQEAKGS
jgi:hypothetical protein